MNSMFINLREKYQSIVYKEYNVIEKDDDIDIEFIFSIPQLCDFKHIISFSNKLVTNTNINNKLLNEIIFNLGIVELMSYYKLVCPKKIIIRCGYLDIYQQKWFKKLYYNGLGEFFYKNKISVIHEELFDFEILGEKQDICSTDYIGVGNLIPVGGGKDSIVTLELLKKYKRENHCLIVNPKVPSLGSASVAGYTDDEICVVKRFIDKKIIDLNNKGFLNGHIPISSVFAFISYLVAYLTNKKYIILSNENSANEPTVFNSNINHQYSKSFEFERDFQEYTKKIFKINIEYFSLLRPIKEIQIGMLFSKYKKYHKVFKSCNLGSKEKEWIWCGVCPKCLFVYIILSPFLSKNNMIDIFGGDLLNKKELEKIFLELIGKSDTKPFECVGTVDEVIYALNLYIQNNSELPYFVKLYKDNYYNEKSLDLKEIANEHHVPDKYLELLKEAIKNA